jgi:hypothetical protein
MNSKGKIKTFFDSKRDYQEYIIEYERNISFFNDLLSNGRKDEIEYVIPIKLYKYVHSLHHTGNYKKALAVLDEIERDLDKIQGQSKFYNIFSEGIIFSRGVCLGRLKKYNDSNVEFKKVLKKDPSNKIYIDWYKANRKNQISRIFNMIALTGIIYYAAILIFDFDKQRIQNPIIREFGLVILILSYSMSWIWGKVIFKNKLKL